LDRKQKTSAAIAPAGCRPDVEVVEQQQIGGAAIRDASGSEDVATAPIATHDGANKPLNRHPDEVSPVRSEPVGEGD